MSFHPLESEQLGMQTLAKTLLRNTTRESLRIGIPRESSPDEKRVSLTPSGAAVLISKGHEVLIERQAGMDAGYRDDEYADAGARIADTAEEIFRDAGIVSKVAPPSPEELAWLKANQVLLSAIHLGDVKADHMRGMITRGVTAIGYEYIQDEHGDFPLVRMMHEITGTMAVQIAAHYLENAGGGSGILLGSISGVPPATVVILGAGITGEYAARTALGYGAQVYVLDDNLRQLRRLENALDRRIITAAANASYLAPAVASADVVIGAALKEGERAPVWVTEEMVTAMKAGSVIVDTMIDQGGCIATSRTTTHSDPVYTVADVIHYCVPNIPSTVARTATQALNNVICPTLLAIGDAGGIRQAIWEKPALRNGTYIFKRHLTKRALSEQFDIPYRDIEALMASDF